jgi:hypothetical protein
VNYRLMLGEDGVASADRAAAKKEVIADNCIPS